MGEEGDVGLEGLLVVLVELLLVPGGGEDGEFCTLGLGEMLVGVAGL